MPFVKLDTGILDSTLWIEKDQRDVFLTALLMAEPKEFADSLPQIEIDSMELTGFVAPPGWYGFCAAAGVGIIRRSLTDPEAGMVALRSLGAPDPESRSKQFEGRRLIRVNGGYVVLNFMAYRDRDYGAADRMRRLRERRRAEKAAAVTQNGYAVTENAPPSQIAPTQMPLEALESPADESAVLPPQKSPGTPATRQSAPATKGKFDLPDWLPQESWDDFEEMRQKIRAPLTDRARRNLVEELQRQKDAGGDPLKALQESITKAWRGVYPANGTAPTAASLETPDPWAELMDCHCPACGDRRRDTKLRLFQGTAWCLKCEEVLKPDTPFEVRA